MTADDADNVDDGGGMMVKPSQPTELFAARISSSSNRLLRLVAEVVMVIKALTIVYRRIMLMNLWLFSLTSNRFQILRTAALRFQMRSLERWPTVCLS